jgi:hypothetical protein
LGLVQAGALNLTSYPLPAFLKDYLWRTNPIAGRARAGSLSHSKLEMDF